jgi:DNA excision repair protein ERCC-3
VQSDRTVLLENGLADSDEARAGLALFAEILKSPEHVHTYRITPLSLWNAAAAGEEEAAILDVLRRHSRFEVPEIVERDVRDLYRRWGCLRLVEGDEGALILEASDPDLLASLLDHPKVKPLARALERGQALVAAADRGRIKQALLRAGWPVEDRAGFVAGDPLPLALRTVTRAGAPFARRPYQSRAVEAFQPQATGRGGSGVVVLPCGAGKTIVGLAVMEKLATSTLVLTTSVTALRQWRDEILERTTLEPGQIGEYSGEAKEVAPVTLATYQILTHRRSRNAPFVHFDLFGRRNWGLIVYDEVHLLPAPVFRILAEIQARRRLGLTATLVREDGREEDVFSLIGPKTYDVPWRDLEADGYIASASCTEVRVPLDSALRRRYYAAPDREAFRLAATNPAKPGVVRELLDRHPDDRVLVIGQFLGQLRDLAERLEAPLLTGATPQAERDRLYASFRRGEIRVLVVSKVANFAVDLPSASVAIQVSGAFGSRQEEAQRLGRILRPKPGEGGARFYTLVSADTTEAEFGRKRQIFLAEQGYRYAVEEAAERVSRTATAESSRPAPDPSRR